MRDAFIFDHVRTPRGRGRPDGALYTTAPVDLAATVLDALSQRNQATPNMVDEVILGCVSAVGEQGADIARSAVLVSSLGIDTPGLQVNRFCGSGLEAVAIAAAKVKAGDARCVFAGGVESMSRVPMGSDGGAWYTDPKVAAASGFVPQGVSADLLATLQGNTRLELDEFAVQSHQRADAAWGRGAFAKSVVFVKDILGRITLRHDEMIRPNASVESLASLPVSFETLGREAGFDQVALSRYPSLERVKHLHHAGNSSAIVDGASAVLLGSSELASSLNQAPRARILASAAVGSEPTIMLTGPGKAARKAISLAGLSVTDIDLFEVNEAFASVVLAFMDDLGVSADRVNVDGGAIAMGHPLGATGAMILGTLLDSLEERQLRYGVATLCVAAGMGVATVIERV